MKPLFNRITDRLLSMLGLDFELSLDMADRPFHHVTDGVVLGSRPRPKSVEDLKSAGVTHVVSCLAESNRPHVEFLNRDFKTLFFPLHDGMYEDITSHFPAFFELADEAERAGGGVFVHCEAGVSRSATLVTALVMRRERLGFFEAYQRVRAQRVRVLPNIGFASQLQRFETELALQSTGGRSSLSRYLIEVCNAPVEAELLESMLKRHDFDAPRALEAVFGGEIPRVVQGVRV